MPTSAYNIYCSIVHMYESDSKKSASTCKSDCKGFQFKGLRGLDLGVMLDVLKKAKDGSLKLNNINAHCYQIKMLENVKTKFKNQVGAESWEDAKKKNPLLHQKKSCYVCLFQILMQIRSHLLITADEL